MAYRVEYQGHVVTCDTVGELHVLLTENGSKPKTAAVQAAASTPQETASNMAILVSKLQKEQRDLLRRVANNSQITRERLRQLTGITDPHQFAGVLIGISKSAAGSKMKSPIESTHERENGSGPRVYQYKIRNSVKAELKEELSKVQ